MSNSNSGTSSTLDNMMVYMLGDGSSYMGMLRQASSATTAATALITGNSNTINNMSRSLVGYANTAIGALMPLVGVGLSLSSAFKAVNLAGQAEENRIAFGTMLQSAEKGVQMVRDLQLLARDTPMGNMQLQQAAKLLLQYGVAGNQIIPLLRTIGDVTGGNTEMFHRMSLAFGQMFATGRLQGQDLLQMVNAGFNPLQEMAAFKVKQAGGGSTEAEMMRLKQLMSQGQISSAMVIESFKRATSEGGLFFGLMEKQSQSLFGLFSTMADDISLALIPLGESIIKYFGLKELQKEVSATAQMFTRWFEGVSEDTKKVAAAIAVATIAVGGLIIAGWGLWTVVTMITGGINVWFALGTLVFGGLIAGTSGLILSLGGVVKTFEKIKQSLSDAWEWLDPIRQAVSSFVTTASANLAQMWEVFKGYVKDAYEYLSSNTTVTWGQVRDTIRDSIIFAEFYLNNFKQVNAVVWAFIQYKAVQAFNEILYYMTVVIPAALQYYFQAWYDIAKAVLTLNTETVSTTIENILTLVAGENWGVMWINLEESLKTSLKNMFNFWLNYQTAVLELLAGKDVSELIFGKSETSVADEAKKQLKDLPDITTDITNKAFKGFKIPPREIGALEAQLRAAYEKQKDALGISFDEFRKKKLEEFAGNGDWELVTEEAEKIGIKISDAINKPDKANHRDAAAFGSAEALQRIEDYRAIMDAGLNKQAAPAPGKFEPAKPAGGAEAKQAIQDNPIPVLKEIRDGINKGNNTTPVTVSKTDLS